ncbi:ATP-grasp domain-containing protein [Paraburkholderia sp. RL17-337-BIB-A]|uniref:ATP-grasp domain-containing protein n=1 Tax=Paraburkholderia sp. RL17-337-BIB-A TaxID=3031636 RepID=UPI0038BD1787
MKILILNNWSGLMHFFHQYVDHDSHEVHYLCDDSGVKAVRTFLDPDHIHGMTVVKDFDHRDEVLRAALSLHEAFPFERVIGVDEFSVLPAARIRDELGIPGPRAADVELYRDKRLMKRRVAESGIRVPRELGATVEADSFMPCVVKRPDGAAAMGVTICHTPEQAAAALAAATASVLVEEFVEGEVFHIDGGYRDGQIVCVPHAYTNTCYRHYVNAQPIGSVKVDEPVLNQRLVEFAEKVVNALPLREGVFHLEVVRNQADDLVFLEIACRVGGGEIYRNFIDVYGMDLLKFHIEADLGLQPRLRRLGHKAAAGWLLMNFAQRPRTLTGFHCAALSAENCMYAMRSVKLGRQIEHAYDYIAFALRAATSEDIRRSIDELIAKVQLVTEPVQ